MTFLRPLAFGLGVLLVAVGFTFFNPWTTATTEHSIWFGRGALLALLIAAIGSRVARLPAVVMLALIGLAALLHFHGLAAVAACGLFLAAALGLGSLLLDDGPDTPWLALPLGVGLITGAAAWLLFLPVFSPASVGGTLLLLVALLHRQIARQFGVWRKSVRMEWRGSSVWASLIGVVLLAALTPTWLPVVSPDDLASHLQIGWQLQTLGYYRMDAGSQAWSLAPWLADVAYGLLQVLAGAEVVGVLNTVWLLLTVWLIMRLGRQLGLGQGMAWLAALLYATVPLTSALTRGMQTETASGAAVAALALVILRAPPTPDRRTLLIAAVLAAYLLGMKIVNLTVVGPLGLLLLWQWRGSLPWRALPAGLALALFIAGASYTYAWILTGNPVLPMFNGLFQSPWFPAENKVDARWLKGLDWRLPFWFSFRTGDYLEAHAGAAGFAVLFLAAAAVPAALDARLRPLLLVALAAWLLPLTQIQYLRYTQPALVLLLPVLLAGMVTVGNRRLLLGAGSLLVLLQLAFLPSSSWMLSARALPMLVGDSRDDVLRSFAPERLIARQLRSHLREDDRVLIASHDFAALAEFAGAAFVTNWYDHTLSQLHAQKGGGIDGWHAMIERSGANHLLIRRSAIDPGLRNLMEQRGATLTVTIGEASLYRLPQLPQPGTPLEAPNGAVVIRFPAPEPAQPRLLGIKVALQCARPFEPFAVGWTLERRGGGTAWARHRWVTCPANGVAGLELALSVTDEWGDLVFQARPVSAESAQSLALLDQGQLNRHDLARERDLSGDLRQVVCRRWRMCRELVQPRVLRVLD
jgi:hypothetical protein